MSEGRRRGVTRGYAWGLILANTVVAVSVLIAVWGITAYLSGAGPVVTENVAFAFAELAVGVTLAALIWVLWSQTIAILRGRTSASWSHVLIAGLSGYLLWSLLGTAAGLSAQETWISPYALSLAIIWACSVIVGWALLTRRLYSDRATPQWPWEKRDEPGPDWQNDRPWARPDENGDDESSDPR